MNSRFTEDGDDEGLPWQMWERSVDNAIGGKRGQKMIAELLIALLEMPEHLLTSGYLAEPETGMVCAVGALATKKYAEEHGLTWREAQAKLAERARDDDGNSLHLDEEQEVTVEWGVKLGFVRCLALTVAYENDVTLWGQEPERRWIRMVGWCARNLTRENYEATLQRIDPGFRSKLPARP